MPRYPHFSDRLAQLSGSVFEKFLPKMNKKGSDLIRLHIGDAYLPPPYELPIDRKFLSAHPLFNRYCNTFGIPALRVALSEKLQEDNQLPTEADDIMMTCGASNALNVAMQGIVNPGDEVLVLTPCWPFFPGMVRTMGGTVREIPFYTRLYQETNIDIAALLRSHLSDNTVALYLNSPNNPSGKVLSKTQLQQVARFVRDHQLWLVSDEAYDGMTYDKRHHYSPGSFPKMFPQTLSIFTFSKVYMFAGLRLGYMAAPNTVLRQLNKALVHTLYSPSTIGQQMMVQPVRDRQSWGGLFLDTCQDLRRIISEGLDAPHIVPEGAYYLFIDLNDLLRRRDYWSVIESCLDAGVSVAPGNDFGKGYHNYVRLCFAGESPERLKIAVERLNQVLA